jgi:hypothetical protein
MRYMTLVELLIALFLAAILLSGLFGFYSNINQADRKLEEEKLETTSWQYTHQRLLNLMSKLSSEKLFFSTPTSEENEISSLVFIHSERTTSFSRLSYNVISRLFVDEHKRLLLLTWSHEKNTNSPPGKALVEVLMENVESISFEFYDFEQGTNSISTVWPRPDRKEKPIPEDIKFFLFLPGNKDKEKTLQLVCPLKHSSSHNVTIYKGS